MKAFLFSIIAAVASSSACLAAPGNTITVSFGPTGAPTCTFSATSIMDGFTNPASIGTAGGGLGSGKATPSPISIVKNVDKCSVDLIKDLFEGAVIQTVTITVTSTGGPPTTAPLLTIALNDVFVTSVSDADSSGASEPTEKVMLAYEKITITADGSTFSCDVVTNSCTSATAS